MKTDKISFGTNPFIGEISAKTGLPKYRKSLTNGIFDAFEKLSQNGTDDTIYIKLGPRKGAKKISTEALEISYFINNGKANPICKSAIAFSPKTLEKFSKYRISKLILDTYEKLKKSNKKTDAVIDYPSRARNNISNTHLKKIGELVKLFGMDDWTCA